MTKEGPHLQDVVPRVVTVVADADLRAHVPAAEGTGAELQAANLQQHVGHSGEAVPLQPQVLEPLKPVEKDTAQLATGRESRADRGWDSLSLGMLQRQRLTGAMSEPDSWALGSASELENHRFQSRGLRICILPCFPGDVQGYPGLETTARAAV